MSTTNGNGNGTGRLLVRHQAHAGNARRESGERWDVAGAIVTTGHVQLARGWRHEVTVEHDAVDAPLVDVEGRQVDDGGPVRRRDTLWLADAGDALRLARAAADGLSALAGRWPHNGLSQLAGRLGITSPEHA